MSALLIGCLVTLATAAATGALAVRPGGAAWALRQLARLLVLLDIAVTWLDGWLCGRAPGTGRHIPVTQASSRRAASPAAAGGATGSPRPGAPEAPALSCSPLSGRAGASPDEPLLDYLAGPALGQIARQPWVIEHPPPGGWDPVTLHRADGAITIDEHARVGVVPFRRHDCTAPQPAAGDPVVPAYYRQHMAQAGS